MYLVDGKAEISTPPQLPLFLTDQLIDCRLANWRKSAS